MKKYIFEYVGGTKGDMVVRFLNGVEPSIRFDRQNITEPQYLGCENWLKLVSQRDMTLERFEEVLSVNPYQYVPAHPLWCCCPTTIQGTENTLSSVETTARWAAITCRRRSPSARPTQWCTQRSRTPATAPTP